MCIRDRAWADKEEQRLLEEQKRLALEQRMEEVKPKVVFAESIEVAKTSISVGEMAKLKMCIRDRLRLWRSPCSRQVGQGKCSRLRAVSRASRAARFSSASRSRARSMQSSG